MADGHIKGRMLGIGVSPHQNFFHLPEHKPGHWYRHAGCQAMEPFRCPARFTAGYPLMEGKCAVRPLLHFQL
jgi:hypothetical protein